LLPVARDSAILLTKIKANPFELPMPPKEVKPPKAKSVAPAAAAEKSAASAKSNPFVAPAEAATPKTATPQAATPANASPPHDEQGGQTLAERESIFIKDVHDEACGVFGTTLGPAANEAHKNHFHLDMKARRHAELCD
jgi:hypothetical protein